MRPKKLIHNQYPIDINPFTIKHQPLFTFSLEEDEACVEEDFKIQSEGHIFDVEDVEF